MGTTEAKGPLRIPKRKWQDNNKMNLQAVGLGPWSGLMCLRIETSGELL